MKCPACGHQNPAYVDDFCSACHARLDDPKYRSQDSNHKEESPNTSSFNLSADGLTSKALADANRLYTVSEAIYKTLIFLNWIIGIFGTIFSMIIFIVAADKSYGSGELALLGIVVLIGTAILCAVNYAIAVLSTHVAKVLSNISVSLLKKTL